MLVAIDGLFPELPLLRGSSQDGRKWLGSPPFISHGKPIWKGNTPILRGPTITMVINHFLNGMIIQVCGIRKPFFHDQISCRSSGSVWCCKLQPKVDTSENTKSCFYSYVLHLTVANMMTSHLFLWWHWMFNFYISYPLITCSLRSHFQTDQTFWNRFAPSPPKKLQPYFMASVAAADDRIEDDHIRHQLLLWGQ